jgi:hypothetical protein
MTRPLSFLCQVTIVVDEANVAFKIKPGMAQETIRETQEALDYFTSFTKQQTRVRSCQSSAVMSLHDDVIVTFRVM